MFHLKVILWSILVGFLFDVCDYFNASIKPMSMPHVHGKVGFTIAENFRAVAWLGLASVRSSRESLAVLRALIGVGEIWFSPRFYDPLSKLPLTKTNLQARGHLVRRIVAAFSCYLNHLHHPSCLHVVSTGGQSLDRCV